MYNDYVTRRCIVTTLPGFTSDGFLPPGDYPITLDHLKKSLLVLGPNASSQVQNWDTPWRLHLVENLALLATQLWSVGIEQIFIDGSFTEDKAHPNDIDGYFVCDLMRYATGQLERDLNRLDPDKIWTWNPSSRKPCPGFPHQQLPMWHKYRIELYPHTPGATCGLKDQFGNEMEFPAAFRRSRRVNHKQRGILKLER